MIKIHDQGVTARGSVVRLCGRECDRGSVTMRCGQEWTRSGPGVDQKWVREWPGCHGVTRDDRKVWPGGTRVLQGIPKRLSEVMPSTEHLGLTGMPNLGK